MIRILRTILKIDSQLGKNASQTAMRTRLIRALQCTIILGGDFNAGDIDWETHSLRL